MIGDATGILSRKSRSAALALASVVVWLAAAASTGPLGIWSAIGGAAVALGLAALLQYSSAAFHTLKFLGVAYLTYLAWRAFRGGSTPRAAVTASRASAWVIFRNGAFVSMFNPKISLLMLALLPQFVNPAASNPELQIGAMGAMHALIAGIVHTNLILFSSGISGHLKKSGRMQKAMRWATATVFLGFGARLALIDQ